MSRDCIYLDYQATTPLDERVLATMLPYFTENFGNSGSVHAYGQRARTAVEAARESIAAGIGARPGEIVFTSGATESNNLAIKGVAQRARRRGNHIVSVATEHRAVLDPLQKLAKAGYEISLLGVDEQGFVRADELRAALRPDTVLVSIMLANNEVGTIQPLAELAELCHAAGAWLHTDATQAVGKIPVDVAMLGVDLLSFTAHKLYGPKGIGALYVRKTSPRVRLESQIDGGGQESGQRSGTLAVPLVVGFAEALRLCLEEMDAEAPRLRGLRDELYRGLCDRLGGVTLNGPPLEEASQRLPHNLNVSLTGVDGESLLLAAQDRLAISTGSACTAAQPEPSHVLQALGIGAERVQTSLRFGLGRWTTSDHIGMALAFLEDAAERLRAMA